MTLTARFPGRCATCKGQIQPGDRIEWDKVTRTSTHERCAPGGAERAEARQQAVAASRAEAPTAPVDVPCPEGLAFRPFQLAGVAYAMSRPATLIGDEPGLGKTVQAAGLINADATLRRVLVVCPASLRLNWKRELETWLTRPLSIGLASSKAWPETDVTIVTWDGARTLSEKLRAVAWDLVVVDEAHLGKEPKAQRTRAVFGWEARGRGEKRVPGDPGIPARRRLALTGTPIVNRPAEAFSILRWLDPAAWPSFFPFGRRYANGHQEWIYVPGGRGQRKAVWDFSGASHLDELQERLRTTVMVRRLKGDVLKELPPKIREVVVLPIDDDARARGVVSEHRAHARRYQDEIDEAEAAVELAKAGSESDYAEAARRLEEAERTAFTAMAAMAHEVALCKAPRVVEHVAALLEGGVEKVLVFGHHLDAIEQIRAGLERFGVVVLTGETSEAARQAAVDRFQTDPAVRVFLGGLKAAGVGLTLTAAAHVVCAEVLWVPGDMTQVEDRAHRIGQTDTVHVQHLVLDGSQDVDRVRALVAKQEVLDRALDKMPVPEAARRAAPATTGVTRAQVEAEAAALAEGQVEAIHDGLRMLSGVCDGAHELDGAGFNKIDTTVGKSLARAARLTARQAALGLRLVTKYRRQLPPELVARARASEAVSEIERGARS